MFAQEKPIHIVAAALLLIAVQMIVFANYFGIPNRTANPDEQYIFCTQEAKQCPDGSYVSRTGPNCEFTLCPSEALCEGGECPDTQRDIIFGQEAEELCGHQPPAHCVMGWQLGCGRKTRKWDCYLQAGGTEKIDISTWKIYRNEEYGFEVRYPNDWEFEFTSTPPTVPPSEAVIRFIKQSRLDEYPVVVDIIVEPNPSGEIPTIGWYKDWVKQIPAGINLNNVKLEEIVFKELPALKANNEIFFAKGKYMYQATWGVIDFGNASREFRQTIEEIFNQILSTFKFIE